MVTTGSTAHNIDTADVTLVTKPRLVQLRDDLKAAKVVTLDWSKVDADRCSNTRVRVQDLQRMLHDTLFKSVTLDTCIAMCKDENIHPDMLRNAWFIALKPAMQALVAEQAAGSTTQPPLPPPK
jgi:hypothetical protein